MQRRTHWESIRRVAGKEMTLFFSSPVGYLFLAAFVGITLFVVFWGEAFFARNIADVRPLFEWMPILLIFLCSALTMRMWSEERNSGTLEHILTLPVPTWNFVAGKFLACLILLGCALATTVFFPVTVSFLGDLDWGPVVLGYWATLLLGATYLSIGLFISSRSRSQIVSLLASVAFCGVLYGLGSPTLTSLVGFDLAEGLRLLGTGSRFESITRGVFDVRDVAYYLGLTVTFLALNAYCLESERWSLKKNSESRTGWASILLLVAANAIGLNLWVGQVPWLRADFTEGHIYSLSEVTESQMKSLREPLIIKGVFSQRTHPLLAPLVPQLKDLLREYSVAAGKNVRVEFVDPQSNPEAERETKEEFALEPVPFQVSDRYEASIVSSYFNIVVKYGDSYEVLGFDDLIEVKGHAADNIEVRLRNPEYDITRAIKKAVNNYQQQAQIFDLISDPITLRVIWSKADKLPESMAAFRETVEESIGEWKEKSGERLVVEFYDPESDEKGKELIQKYGLRPMAGSLFDSNRFYFYLILEQGDRLLQIPLSDLEKSTFDRNFEEALKRFGTGFAKTVGLVDGKSSSTRQLQNYLGDELNLETVSLGGGTVPGGIDVLLLSGPQNLKPKELFAVDQFLMRGGTVIACTSPFMTSMSSRDLRLEKLESGLENWLKHFGVTIGSSLVQDSQCAALPIPVTRYVGGYAVQELRLLDYPYFVDVREEGFAKSQPFLSEVGQLTVPWPSPITTEKVEGLNHQSILTSSEQSWLSSLTNVMPQLDEQGRALIQPTGTQSRHTLGVLVRGGFRSYFESEEGTKLQDDLEGLSQTILTNSPDTAKLIVLASPGLFDDQTIRLFSGLGAGDALSNLTLAANLVDWATEDEALLSIRSRSHFKRTLYPLSKSRQMIWEYLNYGLALMLLATIGLVFRNSQQKRRERYRAFADRKEVSG